ncbi:MAG TPA: HAMP domain-containing sensor histidine kinase, partial [Terracidiphilus sp.]|nr:HAMP domain-containing sensor histidine kinase [Terracidiphilus sp.]
VLVHFEGPSAASDAHPWMMATGQAAIQVSTALFLASLSPGRFRLGQLRILFVIPYALPAVIASVLVYGVFHGVTPAGPLVFVVPALGAVAMFVALLWGAAKSKLPQWIGISYCAALGSFVLWTYFVAGMTWALIAVQCANLLMTAQLLVFVFRRLTPGVVLSSAGFAVWSLTALQIFPAIGLKPVLNLDLIHVIVMGRVVAAIGMIMLTLEDQLDINKLAQERERRARREMEAYTAPILARRRVEDFDRLGDEICELVREHSRFRQAALLLENSGRFRLAGSAGFDDATAMALNEVGSRISPLGFLEPGSVAPAVEQSKTLMLDLTPWLAPGDDLKRLGFTSALAVPLRGRSNTEGVMLLAGLRPIEVDYRAVAQNDMRADDLLPIEMLASRLQATRSQTMMFEKLIDSEKFSGLGQLAANVAHHLNNPLTVILGYASLLEETVAPGAPERKGVESILSESRRMRSTLESLSRISRPQTDQLAAVSVSEMLADMGQLYRNDFLQRSIEFRMNIAPGLPRVLCSSHQLRQAVLHCLQYSIAAVEGHGSGSATDQSRTIRLEATSEGQLVQIMVAHSGVGFANPERAFDPFTPGQVCGETGGLGLSLCATILRDHNGRASAVNLEPQGAAIVLELQTA